MKAFAVLIIATVLGTPFNVELAAQQKRVGGTLRGSVADQSTARPIAGTLVEFMDGRTRIRASTTSDVEGNFVLTNLPDGPFRLRVTRIGYVDTTTPYWRIQSGEILSIIVRLNVKAVPLAPLEISTRGRTTSPVLEGFYARMERRIGGTFISRADIERRNPSLITDLLADVPGVYLEAAPELGRNAKVVSFGGRVGPGGGSCPVQVFVEWHVGVTAERTGRAQPGVG